MRLPLAVLAAVCLSTSAFAQSQQAGNEASTNADETFKKLIEKCDDTDVLVFRARIRLAMGRLDDQAAIAELTEKTNKGLSICGEGKIEEAKASLKETLAAADAKVSEKFGQEGDTAEVKAAQSDESGKPKGSSKGSDEDKVAKTEGQGEKKPWWQFW